MTDFIKDLLHYDMVYGFVEMECLCKDTFVCANPIFE